MKRTEKDGKTEVKNKTHAAGGNDRQDAYLYGHPHGRRKRYRSPTEFFPHLLWLCTDESASADNCTCRVCCPEEVESVMPMVKPRPMKQEVDAKTPHRPAPTQMPATVTREPSNAAVPRPAPPPVKLTAKPLPRPKSADQEMDWGWNNFTYRPGEMVWFKNGGAWSLGVVFRRWVQSPNGYFYTVQQLSLPSRYGPAVTKSSEHEMRPWLAWSVPRYTQDVLNNLKQDPMKYETADWTGMSQRRYGPGNIEVDASILAAKAIDQTYTTFGHTGTAEPEPGVTEAHYDGVYLGAEKMWVGDPIRLVNDQSTDIMVVHSITDRSKRMSHLGQSLTQRALYFTGDVYTLTTAPHNDPTKPSPAAPNNNPQLPQRLIKDLAERNSSSIRIKHQASYWKLRAVAARIKYSEVKGRWYEASLLLPVLRSPAEYDQMKAMGDIQEATFFMNARGDCVNSNRSETDVKLPKQNIWKETRIEAFGRAVPPGAQVTEGFEPPVPENMDPALASGGQAGLGGRMDVDHIDPKWDTAQSADQQQPHTSGDDVDMNTLVNFDDELPGFTQNYDGQNGGGYY